VTIVMKLRVLMLLLVHVVPLLILLLLLGHRLLLLFHHRLNVDRGLLNRMNLRDLLVLRLLIFDLSVVIFHHHLFLLLVLIDLLTRIQGHRAREGRSFSLLALHVRFTLAQGVGKINDLGPS